MVYQTDIWTGDYGAVEKLGSLSLNLQLESSYDNAFADFGEIRMEFEPSGQLCAFDCNVSLDRDSDFWKENFAAFDGSEGQSAGSAGRQDIDQEDDGEGDLDLEEEWWMEFLWEFLKEY